VGVLTEFKGKYPSQPFGCQPLKRGKNSFTPLLYFIVWFLAKEAVFLFKSQDVLSVSKKGMFKNIHFRYYNLTPNTILI
jgi:hypothetical protein